MAMTEAHKQAVRDGIARKRAAMEAAMEKLPDTAPYTVAELEASPVVANAAGVPTTHVSVSEHSPIPEPFAVWLRSTEGQYCSDPRVPQDRVRFSIHLEDVLKKAFNAGYNEGAI